MGDGSLYANSTVVFRCWGWIFDGTTFGAAVNKRYELADGSISTQGVEGHSPG